MADVLTIRGERARFVGALDYLAPDGNSGSRLLEAVTVAGVVTVDGGTRRFTETEVKAAYERVGVAVEFPLPSRPKAEEAA